MKVLMWSRISACSILIQCTVAFSEVTWQSQGIDNKERNQLWYELKNFNSPEKPIVVVVTAYNVKEWYRANLASLFAQKYSNYRVFYIDDCSTDGTAELVERFIEQSGQAHRVTLIKNKEWRSQMANHYTAAHRCNDNEILVNVDGDDWLAHEYVLNLINKVYSYNSQVWFTYGSLECYPRLSLEHRVGAIPENILTQRHLRDVHREIENLLKWNWWHPRTFYAWLFKQVKLQDLLLNGNFKDISPSPDSAFMYPIMEMAGNHAVFIPDILYVWNQANPLSQGHVNAQRQLEVNRIVASWPKYKVVSTPLQSPSKQYTRNSADIVIIADKTHNIEALLNDIQIYIKQAGKITVLYEKSTNKSKIYRKLAQRFTYVNFISVARSNIRTMLKNVIDTAQEHIVLTHALQYIKKPVLLSSCIQELERTFAFGCYIGLSQDQQQLQAALPVCVTLAPGVQAWQFAYGHNKAQDKYSLDFVLYKKRTIQRELRKLTYLTLTEFIKRWYALNNTVESSNRAVGIVCI